MSDLRTFEDAEAKLAEALPGYESRLPQQVLARAIEDAFADGEHLIAEAGCGVGKSFGYLIPAALSGERVVVSTATKALQDQIAERDLPFLAEHLDTKFDYAVLKGRSNYLCLAALTAADKGDVPSVPVFIRRSEDKDFDGERGHLGFEVTDAEWSAVTTSADDCPGKNECPFGGTCFAEVAKAKAQAAHVVVVNHALLLTDLQVKINTNGYGSMLGNYDLLVLDESHELEDWATEILGMRLTEYSFIDLANKLRAFGTRHGARKLGPLATDINSAASLLWSTFDWTETHRITGQDLIDRQDHIIALVDALDRAAIEVADVRTYGDEKTKQDRLHSRVRNTHTKVVRLVSDDFNDTVRWIEVSTDRKGRLRCTIRTAPIDVAPVLREQLWSRQPSVLVSATLTTGKGDFSYVANRIGLDNYRTLDVGTPFDFTTQAALYVPEHLPSPKNRNAWEAASLAEIGELVQVSEGRALILCTSKRSMNSIAEHLRRTVDYTVLKQGEQQNQQLADAFTSDVNSILVATKSFFTGVDFRGEACSLVVIDKLPFDVPNDPLIEARVDALTARGGNGFSDFSIPRMTLVLRQGFGRLIRHRDDKGVVAIFDERLVSKGWGKGIVRSLPDAPLVTERDTIEKFFAELEVLA